MGSHKFAMIGGTTKAGTTSMFKYLSDHPEVCSSAFKETRFFLDAGYPVKKLYSKKESREEYLKLYNCESSQQLKLEATPDYLYSPGTAERIADTLQQDGVKMIFTLRNPVDRFISWYKFAMQDGKIDREETLGEYFKANLEADPERAPQHLHALEQGKYSVFVPNFTRVFGQEKVKIVYFEMFAEHTNTVLKEISEFVDINADFYDTYEPVRYNRTRMYAYPKLNQKYKRLKRSVREAMYKNSWLKNKLQTVGKHVDGLYQTINSEGTVDYLIDDESIGKVQDYYREELEIFTRKGYG